MKKRMTYSVLAAVLTILLSISLCPNAAASTGQPTAEQTEKNHITFTNISQLAPNESVQYIVVDENGMEATVGIEAVLPHGRQANSGLVHRVWYSSPVIKAEFYMAVSGNKVTSVYNDSIIVTGGSYSNDSLTKTSTYGKLSFQVSYAGLISDKCWLQGTVTGSDDAIDVDWDM